MSEPAEPESDPVESTAEAVQNLTGEELPKGEDLLGDPELKEEFKRLKEAMKDGD